MVGGFAASIQGHSYTTGADLWLKDELTNRQRLREAFKELGHGDYPSLETIQFVAGWTEFSIADGIDLHIVTCMNSTENKSFKECYNKAIKADFNGISVPFLHIDDLIANKRVSSRLKDKIELLELERIQKLRNPVY